MRKAENHSGIDSASGAFFRWIGPRLLAVFGTAIAHPDDTCDRPASWPYHPPRHPPGHLLPSRGLRLILLLLIGATGLGSTGCGTTGGAVRSGPGGTGPLSAGLTAAEIALRLPAFPAALDTLYAEADIQVSAPEENGRFSARIAYRRADSMLIRVRFPLGIEGARVLVTPDSAFVYDRIEKRVIAGTPESVSNALPIAVAGTNLVEMATGFYTPDPELKWAIIADSVQLVLLSTDERVRMIIDPERWRITNLQFRSPEGMIIEERWYNNFTLFNQTLLPRRMALSRPARDTRMTLVLRDLDASPGRMSFDLDIDPDAQWHRLE